MGHTRKACPLNSAQRLDQRCRCHCAKVCTARPHHIQTRRAGSKSGQKPLNPIVGGNLRQTVGAVRHRHRALMGAQDLDTGNLARELSHVIIGRVQDQVFGCADLHDTAVPHNRHTVGDPQGFKEIMGDENDGLLQHPLDTQEFVLHLTPDQGVQSAEGFI